MLVVYFHSDDIVMSFEIGSLINYVHPFDIRSWVAEYKHINTNFYQVRLSFGYTKAHIFFSLFNNADTLPWFLIIYIFIFKRRKGHV